MKRFLSIALFALILSIGFQQQVKAADGDIELYPYDQEACLNAEPECTRTKVGDAHWDVSYNGYNYNVARGQARFVIDMSDANSDGFIDATEMPAHSWASFGGIIINDTAEDIVLKTLNARGDLTSVVDRIYVYFDENGDLAMFEDHYVTKHYIFNDGTVADPDWRLATDAEAAAYDAADPKPDTTMLTTIRIALSDTDSDGYVIEPLASLKWYAQGVDPVADPDVTHWSSIIPGDPNNVSIPAGWTVLSFGTLDRDGSNPKTVDWIKTLPKALAAGTADPVEVVYDPQPAWFEHMGDIDDDAVTDGVNIVVDYNAAFDLSNVVAAAWTNMFDATGKIQNLKENLDYSVTISQDGNDLETINFVWNSTTSVYDASAAVTSVDTSDFGAAYLATYSVTTPEGDVTERTADIVIGVMPPKFAGIEDKYINENTYIDLYAGITADDGYGNDETNLIQITAPANFNNYSPLPGVYQMDVAFTHHVHFDGIDPFITLNGTDFTFDGSFNPAPIADWDSTIAVYTDVAALQANTYGWGSSGVMIEVDGSGNVIRTVNRHTWDLVDVNGINTPANASGMFDAWLAGLTLEQDGFVIIVGYKLATEYAAAQALAYGDPISYDLTQVPVFDYDIVTEDSFTVTVDDITAPKAMVIDEDYSIVAGEYDTADAAILANVAAFDAFNDNDDLAIYVSSNGGLVVGTPGTYTVEVTVEDVAGNSAVVGFDVTVVAAPVIVTQAEIDAAISTAIDAAVTGDVQNLIDQQTITQAEVQALIDASVEAAINGLPEDEVGATTGTAVISSVVAGSIALGGSVLLSIFKPFK